MRISAYTLTIASLDAPSLDNLSVEGQPILRVMFDWTSRGVESGNGRDARKSAYRVSAFRLIQRHLTEMRVSSSGNSIESDRTVRHDPISKYDD
jgi:hypothetical protein